MIRLNILFFDCSVFVSQIIFKISKSILFDADILLDNPLFFESMFEEYGIPIAFFIHFIENGCIFYVSNLLHFS